MNNNIYIHTYYNTYIHIHMTIFISYIHTQHIIIFSIIYKLWTIFQFFSKNPTPGFGCRKPFFLSPFRRDLGRRLFRALHEIANAQKTFDVRKCELAYENDRPILLSTIRDVFSTDQNDTDGLEKFNVFIRQNLRNHAPWTGPRSCVILRYMPSVFVYMAFTLA